MPSSARRPTIVVGYDGSEISRAAVTFAARRAGRHGRVYVVHAYDLPPDFLDSARGSLSGGRDALPRIPASGRWPIRAEGRGGSAVQGE